VSIIQPLNSGQSLIKAEFYDAEWTIEATPQITDDGNIVLDMKVVYKMANSDASSSGSVPFRTSEIGTSILMNDGGTTVLGGIIVEDKSDNEGSVFGLDSLPVLGNHFRSAGAAGDIREILVFVTPTIVR